MDECIKKFEIYNTPLCIFSHKKEETLPFSVTWMDLEGTVLSDICERERHNCMISLVYRILKKKKLIAKEIRHVVFRGGWAKGGEI